MKLSCVPEGSNQTMCRAKYILITNIYLIRKSTAMDGSNKSCIYFLHLHAKANTHLDRCMMAHKWQNISECDNICENCAKKKRKKFIVFYSHDIYRFCNYCFNALSMVINININLLS